MCGTLGAEHELASRFANSAVATVHREVTRVLQLLGGERLAALADTLSEGEVDALAVDDKPDGPEHSALALDRVAALLDRLEDRVLQPVRAAVVIGLLDGACVPGRVAQFLSATASLLDPCRNDWVGVCQALGDADNWLRLSPSFGLDRRLDERRGRRFARRRRVDRDLARHISLRRLEAVFRRVLSCRHLRPITSVRGGHLEPVANLGQAVVRDAKLGRSLRNRLGPHQLVERLARKGLAGHVNSSLTGSSAAPGPMRPTLSRSSAGPAAQIAGFRHNYVVKLMRVGVEGGRLAGIVSEIRRSGAPPAACSSADA
jgi:hypothetical protein